MVCTGDACNVGTCAHPALADGTACPDDGNGCTGDACSAGVCEHPSLEGAACPDDGNPCTSDACASSACAHPARDDGSACTDDGNDCTVDMCFSGACGHPLFPDGTSCSTDGIECTSDVCLAGACSHPLAADGTPCCIGGSCTDNECLSGECSPVFHTLSASVDPGFDAGDGTFTTPLDNPVAMGEMLLDPPQMAIRLSTDVWEYDRFELYAKTQCPAGDTLCRATAIPMSDPGVINTWPRQVGTFNSGEMVPLQTHGFNIGTGTATVNLQRYNHSAVLTDQGTVKLRLTPGTIIVPVNIVIVEPSGSAFSSLRSYMQSYWEDVAYYQTLFDDLWVPFIQRFSHPPGKLEGLQGAWDYRSVTGVDGPTFTHVAPDPGEGFVRPDDIFAQCGIQFRLVSVVTIDEPNPVNVIFTKNGEISGEIMCASGSGFELRAIQTDWRNKGRDAPVKTLFGTFSNSAVTVEFSPYIVNQDCPQGSKGLSDPATHISAIGVLADDPPANRFVLAHEMGHSVGMEGDIDESNAACPNLMCKGNFTSHIPACEVRDGAGITPPYNCTPVPGEHVTALASCDIARTGAKSIAMGAGIPIP